MSLLNNSNKGKGKKKGTQPASKPGNSLIPKGNSASKGAKNSRVASRSQRGS